MNAVEMKQKLEQIKIDAQAFLDNNEIDKAESLTEEVKILNAKIEVQEELDVVNVKLGEVEGQIIAKDENIVNITSELEKIKAEKEELSVKYNEVTDKVTELNEQVTNMKPIVDKFHKEEYEKVLDSTVANYKAKFEKVGGSELFETEEIQNLVADTISEDKEVSNDAKISLSDKLMELFDKQDSVDVKIENVQEKTIKTKNLDLENSEFENVYGFKKK